MTPEPKFNVMPHYHRTIMFWFLTVFFFAVLPVVILYTSGYRLVQTEEGERQLTTTGGMYVAVFNEPIDLYINDETPQDRRPFSSAFYVQGYDPGVYKIRTQGEGVETWVKEIPVYPQIVSQVLAFNLPKVPVIRLITPWTDVNGNVVLDSKVATSSTPLSFATTTNTIVRAPLTAATSTLLKNPEYTFFSTLFASTTAERKLLRDIEDMNKAKKDFAFSSELPSKEIPTTSATTTQLFGDMALVKRDEDVFAVWQGDPEDIPHYFCVDHLSASSTALIYGAHVYEGLVKKYASTTGELGPEFEDKKLCRDEIRIDRKWQSVQWFGFLPGSSDLVLMQLQDALYVVEIDDRAWQNVQVLYPGDYLEVLVDAGRVMVKDGPYIMEVFTDLIQ